MRIDAATRNRPGFKRDTVVSHVVVAPPASQLARSTETAMVAGTPAYTSR
jgi:hypothetical protein